MHQQEEAILGLLEGKSRHNTVNPIDRSTATCGRVKVPPNNIHKLIKKTTVGLTLNDVSIFASMGFDMHEGRMVSSSVSFMEDVHQENIFILKRTKVVIPASSYKRTGYTMKFVGSIHPDYSKGITYKMNRHNKMVKTNKMKRNTNYYFVTGDILEHYYQAATGHKLGIDISIMEYFFEIYDRVHVQLMQNASIDATQRAMTT